MDKPQHSADGGERKHALTPPYERLFRMMRRLKRSISSVMRGRKVEKLLGKLGIQVEEPHQEVVHVPCRVARSIDVSAVGEPNSDGLSNTETMMSRRKYLAMSSHTYMIYR